MTVVLETRALCKQFGGIRVTEAVDLRLERGARHALIGPNGAGKTTLINLLTGVLRPSSGTVWLNGEDITPLATHERVRRGVSRTFQLNQLFPRLTVLEAVSLAACQPQPAPVWVRMLRPLARRLAARDLAMQVLGQIGIAALADRRIGELPYGRQRLVEIALALATQPQVLLLDEPAAGIPEGESGEVLATLAALPDSVTLLLIEHDMDLVFRFAKRISVLAQGAVLTSGTPGEVANDPLVQEIYLGRKVAA